MSSKEEVLRVAKLARIHIEEAELETVQKKFAAVLSYVEFLSEANTENILPSYHGVDQMQLREDIAEAPLSRDELLQNAPDAFENCFRIPKVVGAVE